MLRVSQDATTIRLPAVWGVSGGGGYEFGGLEGGGGGSDLTVGVPIGKFRPYTFKTFTEWLETHALNYFVVSKLPVSPIVFK